jgi:hypothetical protein
MKRRREIPAAAELGLLMSAGVTDGASARRPASVKCARR